jgi:hypothetical protein
MVAAAHARASDSHDRAEDDLRETEAESEKPESF